MKERFGHILMLCLLLAPNLALAEASKDWPQFRGPGQSGLSLGNGLLDGEAVGFEVVWQRELGSGYSSISVAGDRGVTMFTDGKDDLLTAFDIKTGKELWRYRIAEMYKGHSGSDDGPVSTPTIDDGVVYGLGPRGQLLAVRLEDGGEVWSRTLDGEKDSLTPHYGFSTVPVVDGDHVIVQTGGPDGHSITAFDKRSGEPRWSTGDDPVNYQSPALIDLAGHRQLVAINDKVLLGIEPSSGRVLWQHEHGTSAFEAFAQPTDLGNDRILVNSLNEVVALQVSAQGDGYNVEELWRSNAFQRSYAIPVAYQGYLYGFSRKFLTCVNMETGETVWKSRPPGGEGLILVDGQLLVVSARGELVAVAASPEGYTETARLALFKDGGMTPPSFAAEHIFVRTLSRMAAIRVTDKPMAAATVDRGLLGDFGELVRRAEASDASLSLKDKTALVDDYLASRQVWPLVEDGGIVHFLYRGEVQDVAIAGNFLGWREEVALDRIAGTDVHFKSFKLDPEATWEYRFNVNFGTPSTDSKNPHEVRSLFGRMSVLTMPGAKASDLFGEPEGPRGQMDAFRFKSEIRQNERRVRVYVPPGYDGGEERFSVVVVNVRHPSLESEIEVAFDNLIAGHRMARVLVVLVPQVGREFGSSDSADYIRMLTEELLPHIDQHYRTLTEPESRAIVGAADGGSMAIYGALKAPGTFGKVGAQSLFLRPPFKEELLGLIEASEKPTWAAILEWQRHDVLIPNFLDVAAETRGVSEALEARGADVQRREVVGAWGWSTWRIGLTEILATWYPPPASE